jgi:hypothetical protein
MKIAVAADPAKPKRDCAPATLISTLYGAGRLPLLSEALSAEKWTAELGNCHEAATGLMVDLIVAGHPDGWRWAIGWQRLLRDPGRRLHSWVEVDGWALDLFPDLLLFTERKWYRRLQRAHSIKLRDADAVRQFWIAQAQQLRVAGHSARWVDALNATTHQLHQRSTP